MSDDVLVQMPEHLAVDLADALELEVETADEHHQTEETMQNGIEVLRAALEENEQSVTIEAVHDYSVHLDIDGLPEGAVSVDYYEDEPRIIIRGDDLEIDRQRGDEVEAIYAIGFGTTDE